MQMDEMCLVMCGVWVCGSDGKWKFVVDKKKMARMVSVEEGISIKELERRCWGWMNLFATVELLGVDGFDIPVIEKKQSGGGFRENGRNVSSVGSKTNFINLDDFELVHEVEKLEERMKAESNTTRVGDFGGCSEGIDSDYSGPEEIDERDVRVRGYDYEFWEPLLAGDLGGSNAVEVVFNDKEAEGLVKMEEARRPYNCYTNNAFDDMVDPGGSSEWERADNKDEEPMDDLSWMGKTSLGGHETRGCETGAELSIEDNGSIFLACDTIMNILLRRKQINFSLERSTFSSLLKVLAYWASGAKDPSVVIMAASICSLIFDFTSEDVLHNTIISA
ncbi:hypothetical protein F2Q68_00012944 [Brassica cretica]|uniref:Uncharacterized protein n=1 Tax=Brassica cretica TaxID=69181 RepID=A0A8S9HHY3_BRACR|nr:hypothetical protein F2Q68_00012944 [Brassica cretica]